MGLVPTFAFTLRISFLLPATEEMTDDFDRLNSIVKRLPRIAELVVQSKLQTNSSEMILDFLLMMSANHQSIQVEITFEKK